MSNWKTYKLGETGKIITGKTPPTKDPENFGKEYPFITPRDMNTQKYIRITERFLSKKGKALLKNNLLPERSICVSCIGSDLGKVVMTAEDSFTNQQLNSIICSEKFDPDFVYYSSLLVSDRLRSIGKSSNAVPIVNKSQFSEFEIQAPEDKAEQQEIAQILSSLDDKIELNLQMNQTLESMAQAIFKEWFVDFNFPDFDGDLVNGLPNGWRKGKVKDVCTVNSNTLSSKDNLEEIHYVEISEVNKGIINNIKKYPRGEEPSRAKRKLTHGDTVLSTVRPNRGSYFLSLFPSENLIASTGFAVFSPISVPFSFLYIFLTNSDQLEFYGKMADGAAYPAINQSVIMDMDLTIPTNEILELFHSVVGNSLLKHHYNLAENKLLTQTRDTLLPKLMSGQLEIQT